MLIKEFLFKIIYLINKYRRKPITVKRILFHIIFLVNKYRKKSITDGVYLLLYNFINYKNIRALKNTTFDDNNYEIYKDFLDKKITTEMLNVIKNTKKITPDDFVKKNVSNIFVKNLEIYEMNEKVVNDYIFVKDPLKSLPHLNSFIIQKIIPLSEKLMGGNISVENIQVYGTSFTLNNFKVNEEYHFDGDLDNSFKLMIYLTDVEISNGPISFLINNKTIDAMGKSGTLIAFKAAKILHAGLAPSETGTRWVLNLKIYPLIGKSRIQYKYMNYFNCRRRFFLFRDMH